MKRKEEEEKGDKNAREGDKKREGREKERRTKE